MNAVIFFALLIASTAAAPAAVPTKVDLICAEGFVLSGSFGNPGGCTVGDQLFVRSDHPQYKQIYAAALAAQISKQKISAYVHSCGPVAWYTAASTFNTVHAYSSLAIEI
jgi:hypothetical protein